MALFMGACTVFGSLFLFIQYKKPTNTTEEASSDIELGPMPNRGRAIVAHQSSNASSVSHITVDSVDIINGQLPR